MKRKITSNSWVAWSESRQAAGDEHGLLHIIGSRVLWNSAGVRQENTLSPEGEEAVAKVANN